MKKYTEMSAEELRSELALQKEKYSALCESGIKLDMSRGKPCTEQLNLSSDMFDVFRDRDFRTEAGFDVRNYGLLSGIPEARRLFAELIGTEADKVIVYGPSSLTIMYDTVARDWNFGVSDGMEPWSKQGPIKFLCPVPGYDRHFKILDQFGIEAVNVKMTPDGPDMDEVERLAASDPAIKGIWCIPKYQNPTGCVYSDETVRRFANLRHAAPDFRVFWDNAYMVHDFDGHTQILNILKLTEGTDNEDMVYQFCSTAKISFSGGGISAMASSRRNIDYTLKMLSAQAICFDKITQLMHVRFFRNADGIKEHMKKHAAITEPKFGVVLGVLACELDGLGIAEWTKPGGGYFISFDVTTGSAKRVYELCREAGVTLTPAGATFPHGIDPDDSNLRIAPTYPSLSELEAATNILAVCTKISALETLIGKAN